MGLIQIEGMDFYAYHGCFKEEQIIGNKFKVDISIETDTDKASVSDDINDALNYQLVYNLIKEEMKEKSHLLEHIGKRILDALYNEFSSIKSTTLKISKLNPPMGGEIEKVSVSMKR